MPMHTHNFKALEPYDGTYECIRCGYKASKEEALNYWEVIHRDLSAFYGWKPGELNCEL